MTIQEIKAAIAAGKKVCFERSSQLVVLVDDWASPLSVGLGVHHLAHNVTMGLPTSALDDCFIYGE
jgi:hypothetical protein